jgi:hypothetical protein
MIIMMVQEMVITDKIQEIIVNHHFLNKVIH